MANAFDQFDQKAPQTNAFDQFDAPEESSVMGEVGRQLGRAGRMAVTGAASVLDTPRLVTDPLYTAGYYGAKALGADDAKEFFRKELARPAYGTMAKEKVDELTDDAFTPKNTLEKATDFVGDVGFSVIAGDKGAKALKSAMTAPIWDDISSGGKKAVDLTKRIAEKRALSSAKYNEALASKEVFPADFSESMVRKTDDFIPITEFEADLTKGSPSLEVAELLQKYRGKPLTIRDIDTLDKKLTNRAFSLWSTEPDEARKISDLQDVLRESLEGYNAGGKLAEGRDLFKQQSVLRDLLKMRESAAMTKNPQTAMATAAKNYLLNPKRAARLTETEKELMQKVAKTGIGTDLANAIGSRLNTIAVSAATGNPAAGVGAFLAGSAGRKAASGLQNKKLDTLIDAIETRPIGKQTAPIAKSPLSREEIQAMSVAGAARVNPESISGLTDEQKLLPAPAIRLPDEVGKPTLETMIPKQKLLMAPNNPKTFGNPDTATSRVPTEGGTLNMKGEVPLMLPAPYQSTGYGNAASATSRVPTTKGSVLNMSGEVAIPEAQATIPDGFNKFVKLARESKDGADFYKKAQAIKGVSPETADWFASQYMGGKGSMATQLQKFVDDVNAGKFQSKRPNLKTKIKKD